MHLIWFGLVALIQLPNFIAAVCEGNQFACKNGECISTTQRCDHVTDCNDGSDEVDCSYPCKSPYMKPCKDGHCIAMYFFCDGENDCGDSSDELNCTISESINSRSCPLNTLTCEGPSCIRFDPMLFISTDQDIRYILLPSKEYGLIQSGISQAHGVAGDWEDGFVYWSEKNTDKAGIYRSLLNGSDYQNVISIGVEIVEDLAIDWIAGLIYFTDSGRKHIVVCDLHGTICAVLISRQLQKPRAVAVYPEKALLFWSDWGSRPHIGSSGMDGSKRTNIITTDIVWPNGLAVDETIQRIYWADAKLNRIESSRLDGTGRIILPLHVTNPYAIDVFENLIYWSDPFEHEILSADKLSGKNLKVIIKEASLTPTGVHIEHPSKQRYAHNPCRSVTCSHLCLLSPDKEGFKCACPTGMSLNKNNRTCNQNQVHQSSIIIATNIDIYRLNHRRIGRNSNIRLPTHSLENITAIVFNPRTNSVIYSDAGSSKKIYSMHLETYRQSVLFENVDTVEGLDVDPFTENIYWTEVTRGTLVLGHRKKHGDIYERVVLARDLQSPKSIALAPEHGIMFIVEGSISNIISVWHMDGTQRREFIQTYGAVTSMAYDGKHLYFSDSLRGTIEHIDLEGQNRKVLRSKLGAPIGMDTSSDSVFWLTQFSSRISWLDKQANVMRGFVIDTSKDVSTQYRLMTVVEEFDFSRDHVCLGHNGNCSDICVPTPQGAKCLGPLWKVWSGAPHIWSNRIGNQSKVNLSLNAIEIGKCPSNTFLCERNYWIPLNWVCDGKEDCSDGKDERDCIKTIECKKGFQCGKECILNQWVCDGVTDCSDGADEKECGPDAYVNHSCWPEHGWFSCLNKGNKKCMPISRACDGYTDCDDRADEGGQCNSPTNCGNTTKCANECYKTPSGPVCSCPMGLQLKAGACVDIDECSIFPPLCSHECSNTHGSFECSCESGYTLNSRDKSSCNANLPSDQKISYISLPSKEYGLIQSGISQAHGVADDRFIAAVCGGNQFACKNGECISATQRCDHVTDCNDRSDEVDCSYPCRSPHMKPCKDGHCIAMYFFCDRENDCGDWSDELDCTGLASTGSLLCPTNTFPCEGQSCIPQKWVCDGMEDCSDGRDELHCNKTLCQSQLVGC